MFMALRQQQLSWGDVLQAYPSIQFKIEITGGSAMAYRIAQKPPLRIVGIRIPFTSDMEENLRIVPEFWTCG